MMDISRNTDSETRIFATLVTPPLDVRAVAIEECASALNDLAASYPPNSAEGTAVVIARTRIRALRVSAKL